MLHHGVLGTDEERRLVAEFKRGSKEARDKLVLHNLRLVKSIVTRVVRKYPDADGWVEDLTSEGILGLFRGLDRFSPSKGVKLGTYVTWWIDCYVRDALRERLLIHLPESCFKAFSDYVRGKWIPRNLEKILRVVKGPLSLVGRTPPFGSCGGGEMQGVINEGAVKGKFPDPSEVAEKKDDVETLEHNLRFLQKVDPRCHHVLRRRLGFDGGEGATLEEVGREIGASRETVRNLEKHGIEMMKWLHGVADRESGRNCAMACRRALAKIKKNAVAANGDLAVE